MSMIYRATGVPDLTGVAQRTPVSSSIPWRLTARWFGIVFIVAGVPFKLGVMPYSVYKSLVTRR
jgi:NADH:ubiquinone oxidoreductase subunit 2 (subunit N)